MGSPSSLLFTRTVALRIILVASSPSLLISWIGLELNTLTFIPLILILTGQQESRAAVTYFLKQTLASVVFLEGALLTSTSLTGRVAFSVILGALFINRGGSISYVITTGSRRAYLTSPLLALHC